MFFFYINPQILSELAEVLFDPTVFLLVINMSGCTSQIYHSARRSDSGNSGNSEGPTIIILYSQSWSRSLLTIGQLEYEIKPNL